MTPEGEAGVQDGKARRLGGDHPFAAIRLGAGDHTEADDRILA